MRRCVPDTRINIQNKSSWNVKIEDWSGLNSVVHQVHQSRASEFSNRWTREARLSSLSRGIRCLLVYINLKKHSDHWSWNVFIFLIFSSFRAKRLQIFKVAVVSHTFYRRYIVMYCQKAINASKLNNLEENKLMLKSEFKGRLILYFQKHSILCHWCLYILYRSLSQVLFLFYQVLNWEWKIKWNEIVIATASFW